MAGGVPRQKTRREEMLEEMRRRQRPVQPLTEEQVAAQAARTVEVLRGMSENQRRGIAKLIRHSRQ